MSNDTAKKTKGTPDSVDVHVGQRLRVRRSLLGLSQEKLADAIGLTFQQIQKYERGMNRISAGRLYQFSKILKIPIAYFYDDIIDPSRGAAQNFGMSDNEQESFEGQDIMNDKETIDLVRTYYSINDPELRKDTIKFMKAMASKT
jgi:transcriptional regulator with XRE-family HTH domain